MKLCFIPLSFSLSKFLSDSQFLYFSLLKQTHWISIHELPLFIAGRTKEYFLTTMAELQSNLALDKTSYRTNCN